MTGQRTPHRVVIAGGGVAALETLIALRDLAGDRVDMTLLVPEESFSCRPMAVAEPFAKGHARHYELVGIAAQFDARLVQDALAELNAAEKAVRTRGGDRLPYDHLVLATGARATPAFAHAITFGDDHEEQALHGLLRDAEEGYVERIAFVVPRETTWTLPLYELALMTASQARSMSADRLELLFVTPEDRPLAIFGGHASDAVAELLEAASIDFVGSAYADVGSDHLVLHPGGRRIDVNRVVSLPRLEARRFPGVPADADGFVPTDAYGRVSGLEGVYAAGDGTGFPIKQGGLAAQQADTVAETIAAAAGAPVEPTPFRPVLRGVLLTGDHSRFLRSGIAGGQGEPDVATHALWWPPTKIAGRYLAAVLFARDELEIGEHIRRRHLEVETDLSCAPLASRA